MTDIAGLIKGASEGAGLGNAFLSHIAAVDGIYQLVRAFESDEIVHVDDSVDPIRDLETIQGELCAKDKDTLSKVEERERERIRKEKGQSRQSEVKFGEVFLSAFEKCNALIDANNPVQTGGIHQWRGRMHQGLGAHHHQAPDLRCQPLKEELHQEGEQVASQDQGVD